VVGHLAFTLVILMIGPGAMTDPGSTPVSRADGPRSPAALTGRPLAPEFTLSLSAPCAPATLTGSQRGGPAGPVALNATAPFSTPSLWPIRGWVVRGFGPSRAGDQAWFQTDIQIASRAGTPVLAPAAGVVVAIGRDARPGHYVILNHGRGVTTRLGNIRPDVRLRPGVRVKRGQVIGFLAASSVPKLHYEVRVGGVPVNPGRYLPCWSTSR
jgi:murein DD-endopeptidase MepM/ murein hydrolase activator NlpD